MQNGEILGNNLRSIWMKLLEDADHQPPLTPTLSFSVPASFSWIIIIYGRRYLSVGVSFTPNNAGGDHDQTAAFSWKIELITVCTKNGLADFLESRRQKVVL